MIKQNNFNHIHGFSTTHYTMWRLQCAIYISNKSQYLKNKERYGKTIHGVPLWFQEFIKIRQNLIFISYSLLEEGILGDKKFLFLLLNFYEKIRYTQGKFPSCRSNEGNWWFIQHKAALLAELSRIKAGCPRVVSN